MKKIVCAMLCILLVFRLSACGGNVNEVNTHNVESEIYSEEARFITMDLRWQRAVSIR